MAITTVKLQPNDKRFQKLFVLPGVLDIARNLKASKTDNVN